MSNGFLATLSWPSALASIFALLIVVLGLVIWSIRRHRDPRLVID